MLVRGEQTLLVINREFCPTLHRQEVVYRPPYCTTSHTTHTYLDISRLGLGAAADMCRDKKFLRASWSLKISQCEGKCPTPYVK